MKSKVEESDHLEKEGIIEPVQYAEWAVGLEQRLKFNLRTFVDKMHRRFEALVLQLFDKFI